VKSEHLKGRGFVFWALHASGASAASIARAVGLSRDRVGQIIKREERRQKHRAHRPWLEFWAGTLAPGDARAYPAWMIRLEQAGAIPRRDTEREAIRSSEQRERARRRAGNIAGHARRRRRNRGA
jgi:hypothetical protein